VSRKLYDPPVLESLAPPVTVQPPPSTVVLEEAQPALSRRVSSDASSPLPGLPLKPDPFVGIDNNPDWQSLRSDKSPIPYPTTPKRQSRVLESDNEDERGFPDKATRVENRSTPKKRRIRDGEEQEAVAPIPSASPAKKQSRRKESDGGSDDEYQPRERQGRHTEDEDESEENDLEDNTGAVGAIQGDNAEEEEEDSHFRPRQTTKEAIKARYLLAPGNTDGEYVLQELGEGFSKTG
jgi:hypothetical protein